jgi:hypothetical protein
MNKYIVAHNTPFSGNVNVGLVEADSVSQAIYKAAEIDGWDVSDFTDGSFLAGFLRSIEDKYVAVNVVTNSFPAYPGVSS